MPWRDLGHLVLRFLSVARGRGPRPRDQALAAALLRPEETGLFWAQPPTDQRHGIAAARAVIAVDPGDHTLARAALLHDIGKRHARLGAVSRSLASGLALLRLPAPGRLATYLDHGRVGAAELDATGAEPLVVAFTAHHHGDRPDLVPEAAWRVLQAADRAR